MGTKVIVKQFGGDEIGVIRYDKQGQLIILAHDPKVQAALVQLVDTLTERPLTAVSGNVRIQDGQSIHETVSRPVSLGEPRFLLALADAITQSRHNITGKRIRAFIETDTY